MNALDEINHLIRSGRVAAAAAAPPRAPEWPSPPRLWHDEALVLLLESRQCACGSYSLESQGLFIAQRQSCTGIRRLTALSSLPSRGPWSDLPRKVEHITGGFICPVCPSCAPKYGFTPLCCGAQLKSVA